MIQKICLIILIMWPTLKGGISIGKDLASEKSDKSASVVAGLILLAIEYAILYFSGIFTLL